MQINDGEPELAQRRLPHRPMLRSLTQLRPARCCFGFAAGEMTS